MDFQTAVRTCFQKYATFSGRAARSEYWWFVAFMLAATLVLGFVEGMVLGGSETLSNIFSLAVLIPNLAVTARRLHDNDKSGWWIVLPYGLIFAAVAVAMLEAYILVTAAMLGLAVAGVLLLIWTIRKGTDGPNRFGPDPLGGSGGFDGPDDGEYARSTIPHVPRG